MIASKELEYCLAAALGAARANTRRPEGGR